MSQGHKVMHPIHPAIHIICSRILLCLDTDHTDRTWFSSSWQQCYQATNQSALSPFLHSHWLHCSQPVVECPSLTSLLPCTFHTVCIFLNADYSDTCLIFWDVMSCIHWCNEWMRGTLSITHCHPCEFRWELFSLVYKHLYYSTGLV